MEILVESIHMSFEIEVKEHHTTQMKILSFTRELNYYNKTEIFVYIIFTKISKWFSYHQQLMSQIYDC